MAGQLFSVSADGGYAYSDELSDTIRLQVQPLAKFRQLCDMPDGEMKGLHAGATFVWNVYSDVATQGRRLDETSPIPQSQGTIRQETLTMTEAGLSVPYTGLLADLAKHDVVTIIDKLLKEDARKYFDIEANLAFNNTPLRAGAATSTTSVVLDTTVQCTTTNNVALGTGHVKAIIDAMKERSIPR